MTEMKTNLFIGGRCDGDRKDLPSDYATRDQVRIPFIADKQLALYNANGGGLGTDIGYEVYRREKLSAIDTIFEVWVFDEMTLHQAMTELLAGYQPARKPVTP